jgi:type IV secretory pathway TraG/TraD family ATPase VirD4
MMASRTAGTDPGPVVLFGGLAAVLAMVGGTWAAVKLGIALGDPDVGVTANPLAYLIQLAVGKASWPGSAATMAAAVLAVLLIALGTAVGVAVQRWQSRDRSIDGRARHLATRHEVRDLAPKAAAATAARLRPGGVGGDRAEHGIDLGSIVNGGNEVLASWEDTIVLIAGPRRMKSTCYVIPAVVNAPGPAVATSNKRDVHDATRGVRARHGRIWCFDPQRIIGRDSDFWFNPLAEVRTIDHARELASHFAMGVRSANARSDAYFDPKARACSPGCSSPPPARTAPCSTPTGGCKTPTTPPPSCGYARPGTSPPPTRWKPPANSPTNNATACTAPPEVPPEVWRHRL